MDSKYYDLDIPRQTVSPELIARLLDCGYTYIAISTTINVDEFTFRDKKKTAKDDRQQMRKTISEKLSPLTAIELSSLLENSAQFRVCCPTRMPNLTPPRLFNRLTLTCENTESTGHFFKEFDDHIRQFDFVAFEPLSASAINYVLDGPTNLPIDLVTVDPSKSSSINDFRPSGKQCTSCLRRGLYFDIPLSPSLFRSGARIVAKTSVAALLVHVEAVCRFQFPRLLVITSRAQSGWEVRRPQAVASVLCALCPSIARNNGPLSMQQSNPWQVISRGLSRRDSKTTHGAAVLMRLLADPTVVEVVRVARDDSSNDDVSKEVKPKDADGIKRRLADEADNDVSLQLKKSKQT